MSGRESNLGERAFAALREAGFAVIEKDALPGTSNSRIRADLLAWGPDEQGEFGPVALVEIKSAHGGQVDRQVLAHLASYANAFGTEENYLFDGEWWLASQRFDRLHPAERPRSARPAEHALSVSPASVRRLLTSSMWNLADRFRNEMESGEAALAALRSLGESGRGLDWLWSRFGDEGAEALIEILQSQLGRRSIHGTPLPLARGMARLLKPAAGERVLDPFCGLGALLWGCHRNEDEGSSLQLVGVDRNSTTVAIATEIASVSQTASVDFRVGNAFDDPAVAAWDGHFITHPPFGLRMSEPVLLPDGRDTTDGDVAVLALLTTELNPGMRGVFVLPRSVLYKKASEGLRSWLTVNRRVVAVIGLPPGALDVVSIPTAIVVVEHSEPTETIVASLQDDWADELSVGGAFMVEYTERLRQ